MRTIETMLVIPEGKSKTIKTNFMQVLSSVRLPELGEPITAVEMTTGVEYPGEVIQIDRVRHGYVAEVHAS